MRALKKSGGCLKLSADTSFTMIVTQQSFLETNFGCCLIAAFTEFVLSTHW
jgi:hypothetical protein